MVNYSPAIVIACYNRPNSLKRLLNSIVSAYYDTRVALIISIDKSDISEVLTVAESFVWPNGEKIIINHKENLGLKKHVLSCGDLTLKYESIILLEDDLFVSPYYYNYAKAALDYYDTHDDIGGISLFSHQLNVHTKLPFIPLKDDSDVFMLQLPSSWGQAWSSKHWTEFRNWYGNSGNLNNYNPATIPQNIINWPPSSWLKIFTKYIIEKEKYFVYPNISLTTNFADAGTNFKRKFSYFQVPLQIAPVNYKFKSVEASVNVYDAFFEILPARLRQRVPSLFKYSFIVDLYGNKNVALSNCPYLLTTKSTKKYIKSYGMDLKPIEMNILKGIEGREIKLVENIKPKYSTLAALSLQIKLFQFYYRMPLLKELVFLFFTKFRQNLNG